MVKQPRGTQRYRPTQREDEDALTQATFAHELRCQRARGKVQLCKTSELAPCRAETGRSTFRRGLYMRVSSLAPELNLPEL